jgi:hypothetical protein
MLRILGLVTVFAVLFGTGQTARAVDRFDAYAGPCIFGPTYNLRAHIGAAPYTISYQAIGKTVVTGEVTFIDVFGKQVTVPFNGTISFRTGNFVGVPKVRFKGVPFGSAVKVTVSP